MDSAVVAGTPGKRFAEYTVKGSVKICAKTGDTPVCTEFESPLGAGGLYTISNQITSL